jgi:CyaY protein
MDERAFHDRVDALFMAMEDALDDLDQDIDVDSSGGILTLGFLDGSAIIFSRQIAGFEVWVAARSGGYHLALCGQDFRCGTTDEGMGALTNRVIGEHLGTEVSVL